MSDGRAYSAPFVTPVPEHSEATVDMPTPGTLPLLVTGLISLLSLKKRRPPRPYAKNQSGLPLLRRQTGRRAFNVRRTSEGWLVSCPRQRAHRLSR
jgi:hypothetical protein